jgi:hypothetical protein
MIYKTILKKNFEQYAIFRDLFQQDPQKQSPSFSTLHSTSFCILQTKPTAYQRTFPQLQHTISL